LRVQTVEYGAYPNVTRQFVPTLCQHCEDAPCIPACPTAAIGQNDSGIVTIDGEACVGSGACVSACPYGAIYIDEETQTANKCDLCQDRVGEGELPACVATCPTDAIRWIANDGNAATDNGPNGKTRADGVNWELASTRPRLQYKGLKAETARRLSRINAQ